MRELPIVSPHGHVDPRLLLDDEPFPDPATLFVTPDHYVTRLLHADGVPLDALGVGQGPLSEDAVARGLAAAVRALARVPRHADAAVARGRAGGDLRRRASARRAETADAIYDQLAERLAQDAYRPRALYERFRIEVLATTDDPCDDLAAHAALAADPSWPGRVIPTFRPDRYLEPAQPGWADAVRGWARWPTSTPASYVGYVRALE